MEEIDKQKLIIELRTFCKDLLRYKARQLSRQDTKYTKSQDGSLDALRQRLQYEHGRLSDVIIKYAGEAYIPIPFLNQQLEVFSHSLGSLDIGFRGTEALDATIQLVNKTIGKLETASIITPKSNDNIASKDNVIGRIGNSPKAFISHDSTQSLPIIENIVSDLEVLAKKCERDIDKKNEIWSTPYYIDEFNRILDIAKKYCPERCVDISNVNISDLSRAQFKQGSVSAGDAALLNTVDSHVSKLLGRLSNKDATQIEIKHASLNKNRVFVIHGRNKALLDSMFDFLRAIGLDPIEWSQAIVLTGKPTPTIQEIVTSAFNEAQATIVLLSGDDIAKLRDEFIKDNDDADEKELTPQARPNVLFEAGMAMTGNQERTILVQIGKVRKFSDTQGLHFTHLDNTVEQRMELINKLRSAGCNIEDPTINRRWVTIGKFTDTFNSTPIISENMTNSSLSRLIKPHEDINNMLNNLNSELDQIFSEIPQNNAQFIKNLSTFRIWRDKTKTYLSAAFSGDKVAQEFSSVDEPAIHSSWTVSKKFGVLVQIARRYQEKLVVLIQTLQYYPS